MANITNRNGSFQVRVYIGRDANGKQLFKTATCSTEKEARRAAREFEQEKDEGKLTHIENHRVVVWIEKFMEINKNSYAPSTRVLYKGYLKNHWKPFFKQMKLKELNEIHLKQLLNQLLGKMSDTSARRCMSALRTMLNDALKKRSPARDIKLPKEDKVEYTIPTTKQFFQIHEAVMGTRDEPIVLLAGWCGLRRGEIFALKIGDIDFKNETVRIDEGLSINEDSEYEFKDPKSINSFRTVPVPDYLMNLLRVVVAKQAKRDEKVKELKLKKDEKEIKLFSNRPDNYSSYWAKLRRRKKIPEIRFHDLRHYHATWLYYNDFPDKYAAKLLGDDVNTLKRIYQHLGLDKEQELDDRFRQLRNQK